MIQVSLYSYSFCYAAFLIRLSAYQYYFDYCITSGHQSRGLSEYKIVLKLNEFRISGLLFLWLGSYPNKPTTVTPGALKPYHPCVMIQEEKSSNKN